MTARLALYLSLFVAMVFAVMPLPALVQPYRPDWILLVVGYWALALPHRINIGTAWTMGLLVDVLQGSVLGAHALGFSVAIYVMAMHFRKIRNFSVWQQALIVAVLSFFCQLVIYWMTYLAVDVKFERTQLWSVVVNLILWPWLFFLLRRIRRHFHVR